ncbi:3'-5' DNA helicase [Phaffia rhodozyma]|uniref:DNA 3'-5' helicase n=1 Tax=Phaffia rhodozyma TaxID=264483 RepID=A0A0F7SVX4_PHARH|nr:3'-5' DNA helicase [Phaffia rhodozyma]
MLSLRPSIRTIHLESLNAAQTQAVITSPAYPLQILAGPGTGKTRVLTSRIIHLIKHHGFKPESICAVTFTKRAAAEMQIRLHTMLGGDVASKLVVGTFHSVCLRYLRKYHLEAGLPPTFQVIDEEVAFGLMSNLIRRNTSKIMKMEKSVPFPGPTLAMVSAIKMSEREPKLDSVIELLYLEYQKELRRRGQLDFDDLLVYAVDLFERHPELTRNIKHIFIDEFQDTNSIQYKLAKQFTDSKRTMTVVGDPDQSIYGWRSAVKENMENMYRDLPDCSRVLLEENYRSTGHIVAASDGIISQDIHRIDKHLWTANPRGKLVFTKCFDRTDDETHFFAKEIVRLKIAYGLEYSDFAILMRYNAQSRAIEQALKELNVPCRILNDQRYYYRPQIRAIIAYLRLIDDETVESAFQHVFDVIASSSEPLTTKKIVHIAEKYGVPSMTYLRGPRLELTGLERSLVTSFLHDLDKIRKFAYEGATISQLIDYVVAVIRPELIWDSSPDQVLSWKNIVELKDFATKFQLSKKEMRALKQNAQTACSDSLTRFLLKTFPGEIEEGVGEQVPEVVISTVHRAKGLEWPVVFIPAVEHGFFPVKHVDQKDTEEERRVFFVAATRAQALLFLTHSRSRQGYRSKSACVPSPFLVEALRDQKILYTDEYPVVTADSRIAMYNLLRRDIPNAEEIERDIAISDIPLDPSDAYYLDSNRRPITTFESSQVSLSPVPPLSPNTAQYEAKVMEFESTQALLTWFFRSKSL